MRKRVLCSLLGLVVFFAQSSSVLGADSAAVVAAQQDWRGKIPAGQNSLELWVSLTNDLLDQELYFGAVAAAERMLLYFGDPTGKEAAYRVIVKAIREGYPFLVHDLFREGELQPEVQDAFTDTYFTYKGIINEKLEVPRWSEAYFKRIDPTKVPEFLFYQGIKSYRSNKLDQAVDQFSKILDLDQENIGRSFSIRVARTLARIHFEKESYQKSLEIYDTFLLKLNPLRPDDWLEAAWNLFYLKRYSRALGYLYNLEAPSADSSLLFEKYILRGLIYKQLCAEVELDSLYKGFMYTFGAAIQGVKLGQPLKKFPFLREVSDSSLPEYQRVRLMLSGLQAELPSLGRVRAKEQARQLYATEIARLKKSEEFFEYDQYSHAAAQLIQTAESLAFLKFEMQRERFDPDKVFAADRRARSGPASQLDGKDRAEKVTISWKQAGDFWRSERPNYEALIEDQCKR